MDAVLEGTTRFYAGRGLYEAKARRGFQTANLYIYYRASTKTMNMAIRPWLVLLSEWNRLKRRGLKRTNERARTAAV